MTTMPNTSASRAARMEALLMQKLAPHHLKLEDESARHAGHAGARAGGETHYAVTIVSSQFNGLARVERSRMVHTILADEFSTGLHALSLILRSSDEQKS
jgi:BolA protein